MISMNTLFQKELEPDPNSSKIIEIALDVTLPDEYKKFVETVGVIDRPDLIIHGTWKGDQAYDIPSVIGYTRILRRSIRIPENYISVQSVGSDEVLLDTETGYMFCWYEELNKILPLSEYESFEHYVKEKLKDKKEGSDA